MDIDVTRAVFAAHIATTAATEVMNRRRVMLPGKTEGHESHKIDAIAHYTTMSHRIIGDISVTALETLMNDGKPHSAIHAPADVPKVRAVTRRRHVLDVLSYARDALRGALAVVTAPPVDGAAVALRGPVTAAVGQWAIAYRAYQRAIGRRRPPLTERDVAAQVAGLAHALSARVPEHLRSQFDARTTNGSHRHTFDRIVALTTSGHIPVTIVERDTIVSLLYHFDTMTHPPSVDSDLTIMAPADIL